MEESQGDGRISKSRRLLGAIKDHDIERVESILEEGVKLNRMVEYKRRVCNEIDTSSKRKCYYTPICIAVADGTEEILRKIIEKGADINRSCQHVENHDRIVFDPLFLAVDSKNLGMVEELLKAGADGNNVLSVMKKTREEEGGMIICNYEGMCYLHYAAAYGSAEMMDLLMKYGADPNKRTFDCPERPIRLIQHDDSKKIHSLLAGGADLSLETAESEEMHWHPNLTLLEHFLSTMESGDTLDDMFSLLTLLHAAGYDFKRDKNQPRVVMNAIKTIESNPHTLQHICRLHIRKVMGSVKFQEKLQELPLPTPMKNFLSFRLGSPGKGRRQNAAATAKSYLLPRDM